MNTPIDFPEKSDRNRLLYLYSEIQEEDIQNIPSDIIDFWKNAIVLYSFQRQTIRFTIEELQHAFTAQGIIPMSIHPVLQVLKKESYITPEQSLSPGKDTTSSESLLATLVSSLWSYGNRLLQSDEDRNKEELTKPYLNTFLFQEIHKYLIQFLEDEKHDLNRLNGICSIEEVPKFPNSLPALVKCSIESSFPDNNSQWRRLIDSFRDYDLLANFLIQQGSLNRIDDKIVQINKFSQSSVESSSVTKKQNSSFSLQKISSTGRLSDDVALAKFRIQLSLHQVSSTIDHLQQKIQDYYLQALKAKKIGNDSQALLKLKLKKTTTETQNRLFQAQYNLEEALQSLDTSHLNNTIIKAYQMATYGLKKSREESGLTAESVDEVIEDFQNEMDELKAIDEVMEQHQSIQYSSEDEEALVSELEELMKADQTTVNKNNPLPSVINLPKAPVNAVTLPSTEKDTDVHYNEEKHTVPILT